MHMNNQKTGSNKIIRQGASFAFVKVGLSKNKAFQQADKPTVRQAFCHPGSAPGAGSGAAVAGHVAQLATAAQTDAEAATAAVLARRDAARAAVAAATAAALGVLTPMPCIPATPAPWVPGAPTVLIGSVPALDHTCRLACLWAGTIEFVSPGQATVHIP